jgi:cbb3-type cytochrome oxidase subunit 3
MLEFLINFQSIWTVIVFILFIAIVMVAYSSKNKNWFEKVGRSPLEDDDSIEATIKEKHHV